MNPHADRALLSLLHPGIFDDEVEQTSTPQFDGGPRGDGVGMPRGEPRHLHSEPSDERGWGPEYELEDGNARLSRTHAQYAKLSKRRSML